MTGRQLRSCEVNNKNDKYYNNHDIIFKNK